MHSVTKWRIGVLVAVLAMLSASAMAVNMRGALGEHDPNRNRAIDATGGPASVPADGPNRGGNNTADADALRPCTLAVMGELHARPDRLPLLRQAFAKVDALASLFGLVVVGDLCANLGTSAEYEVLRRSLKDVSARVFAVPGNHDILYRDNLVDGERRRGTPAERKTKQERFKRALNLKSLFYARKAGGHLLVFLPPDALRGMPNCLPSDETFAALRRTLRANRHLPTIIFCHAALDGSYGERKAADPLNAFAQPSRKIRRILRDNPQVYLWFASHLHTTPSQADYNCPENKVGRVTVIHVPPAQARPCYLQTVRLSPKGAIVRTMDVGTGRFLKRHTRVFRVKSKTGPVKPATPAAPDPSDDIDRDKGLGKARIVVTNAHSGGNRNRDGFGNWLADQEPDVALVCEASGMTPHLRPAGRVYDAGSSTKGRREVAIVVRHGLPVAAHDQGKVSPDLGTGIAHDRWWTRVQTRVAGVKTRIYSLHLNAVIQERSGEPMAGKRWAVTREGLVDLENRWREDIKAGWGVLIGGDLNWNDARSRANSERMAPGRVFGRLGLTYVNHELMWLAWTPGTHQSAKRQAIPPTSIPGLIPEEHPALRIDLRARPQPDDLEPDGEESRVVARDEEPADDERIEAAPTDADLETADPADDSLLDGPADPAPDADDASTDADDTVTGDDTATPLDESGSGETAVD